MSRQLGKAIDSVRAQFDLKRHRSWSGSPPEFRRGFVPARQLRTVGVPVGGFDKPHHRLAHAEEAGPMRRSRMGREGLHPAKNPAGCALGRRQSIPERYLNDNLK